MCHTATPSGAGHPGSKALRQGCENLAGRFGSYCPVSCPRTIDALAWIGPHCDTVNLEFLRDIREHARNRPGVMALRTLPSGEDVWEAIVPWDAGLSFDEACRQEDICWDRARSLWARFQKHVRYAERMDAGNAFCQAIGDAIVRSGNPPLFLTFSYYNDLDLTLAAGVQLRQVIDAVYRRHGLYLRGKQFGRVLPQKYVRDAVTPLAIGLRGLAQGALRDMDEPLDEWHQATMLSWLLQPALAEMGVSAQFWHAAPGEGQTDRERQVHIAVGSNDVTQRHATRARRAYERAYGITGYRGTPGPASGSHRKPNPSRAAFERLLLEKQSQGLSAQTIAELQAAQNRYQDWKGDHAAHLTERIVRHHLREFRQMRR